MKEKLKKRNKEKKEFEKALLKDMAKNMGNSAASGYMRGMGLMIRQIAPPKTPKPTASPRK